MMFLSEVWFSIEGSPHWVQVLSKFLPLTHILSAARKIISDGATLVDVRTELGILMLTAALFLIIGASLFSWSS